MAANEKAGLARARALLAAAKAVVALTGAGISTGAGIPDFRGPEGEWTRNPLSERLSNLDDYLRDPAVRALAWQRRAYSPALTAQPTPAHRALAAFERTGRLRSVVTQNTDGLHLAAGHRANRVREMHGHMRRWRCEDCHADGPIQDMVDRVLAGEADPRCPECGGVTRATVILFGENLDAHLIGLAWDDAKAADLVVAIGSTLTVQPVASLVDVAKRHGAGLIILNAEATPYDRVADVVLRGDIQDVAPRLFEAV
ncbi:MAG: Sir2 family NAD-dependent protein deacetylase [Propionibacteriaceae bacterium]|jgi:NAD-dependent deacetylase|nr:Sir2 family NAD-dependent protein deacetylase [Propionibacteriaceae bacterium]